MFGHPLAIAEHRRIFTAAGRRRRLAVYLLAAVAVSAAVAFAGAAAGFFPAARIL